MPPCELAKDLPNLPLSVVAHPSSSAEDFYPFPPSPSSLHPAAVIDANIKGIVLTLPSSEIPNALNAAERNPQILAYMVPQFVSNAQKSFILFRIILFRLIHSKHPIYTLHSLTPRFRGYIVGLRGSKQMRMETSVTLS
ncbi:hypothetical protein D9613_002408 [Agrocybe pediades]|uniref:Uncharacterized protein n=1 Tax=Agrocybe pediades TaxID=84607 RepID=A0A8H4R3N3_9AGAR|nr:hypothetical protein D9613_002408 [Agrocybe pediades]